jgi:hypothetical protein
MLAKPYKAHTRKQTAISRRRPGASDRMFARNGLAIRSALAKLARRLIKNTAPPTERTRDHDGDRL